MEFYHIFKSQSQKSLVWETSKWEDLGQEDFPQKTAYPPPPPQKLFCYESLSALTIVGLVYINQQLIPICLAAYIFQALSGFSDGNPKKYQRAWCLSTQSNCFWSILKDI